MVSLYYVQKFLFELNRDPEFQSRYTADRHASLSGFDLSHEEKRALVEPDIGLLFHLGVNGQILMHFAAFHSIEWQDYLQQMRDGLETTVRFGKACTQLPDMKALRPTQVD